jgi:hypothetical protein
MDAKAGHAHSLTHSQSKLIEPIRIITVERIAQLDAEKNRKIFFTPDECPLALRSEPNSMNGELSFYLILSELIQMPLTEIVPLFVEGAFALNQLEGSLLGRFQLSVGWS